MSLCYFIVILSWVPLEKSMAEYKGSDKDFYQTVNKFQSDFYRGLTSKELSLISGLKIDFKEIESYNIYFRKDVVVDLLPILNKHSKTLKFIQSELSLSLPNWMEEPICSSANVTKLERRLKFLISPLPFIITDYSAVNSHPDLVAATMCSLE